MNPRWIESCLGPKNIVHFLNEIEGRINKRKVLPSYSELKGVNCVESVDGPYVCVISIRALYPCVRHAMVLSNPPPLWWYLYAGGGGVLLLSLLDPAGIQTHDLSIVRRTRCQLRHRTYMS